MRQGEIIRHCLAAVVLVAATMAAGADGARAAPDCPSLTMGPEVDVRIDEGPVRLDHSRSRKAIQGISTGQRSEPLPGSFKTAGVTQYAFEIRPSIETRAVNGTNGGTCTFISRIKVTMRYRDQTVYLPSDYPKGSCQYGVIMTHEQQHVEINRQTLREYGTKLRTALNDYSMLQTRAYYTGRGQGSGTDALLKQVQQVVEPVVAGYAKANRERNAQIDTRQEYQALSRLCPTW